MGIPPPLVEAPAGNPFAKIIRRDLEAAIVYEDGQFMVFKDHKPSAPFHLQVIPTAPPIPKVGHSLQHSALPCTRSLAARDRNLMGTLCRMSLR